VIQAAMNNRTDILLDYAGPKTEPANSTARAWVWAGSFIVVGVMTVAVLVPKFNGGRANAKQSAAANDIQILAAQLDAFNADNQRYPTTAEGLAALVGDPGSGLSNQKRSYTERAPTDPWGQAYIYRFPGSNGKKFDLLSGGPDGREGGGDDIVAP